MLADEHSRCRHISCERKLLSAHSVAGGVRLAGSDAAACGGAGGGATGCATTVAVGAGGGVRRVGGRLALGCSATAGAALVMGGGGTFVSGPIGSKRGRIKTPSLAASTGGGIGREGAGATLATGFTGVADANGVGSCGAG